MLAYYINNIPLHLAAESSVRIVYYNPACYFEEIPGDVAMGIEIPVNEHNRAVLGNPERFEKYNTTKNDREFKNFEIRFSGKLLLSGTLVIQSTSAESYSGWGRNNVGNLGKEHRDKFIYDIPAFNKEIEFVNKANYNPLTDPYGCPTHFNPDFFKEKGHIVNLTRKIPNPDYVDLSWWEDLFEKQQPAFIDEPYKTEALTEAFRRSAAWFVNKLSPDNSVDTMGSTALIKKLETELFVNVLSPMLFLNFIIEALLRDAHFFVNNSAIKSDPDLQKLILYNNFDITHVEFVTEFQYEPAIYIKNDWFEGYTQESTSASIQSIKRSYDQKFLYKDLLPKIKLKDFFLSIQNLLNVCFHFRPDGKVDIVDREKIITSAPIDISKYLVGDWNMGEQKDVALKFLFSHDDNDVMFSERWTDIDDRRIYEGDPVAKWDDLESITNPIMGEIRYLIDVNLYVEYAWIQRLQIDPKTGDEVSVDALGWRHLTSGFQNGFFNRKKNEEETIKTDFSTLQGDQNTMTQHRGNLETMKFSYENFTPRLLFYLDNNIAKNSTENIALDWEKKDKGLLATRWPKWSRFWCQRQPVSIPAALSINMIDYIARNITSRFRSNEGDFIIETMETEYNLDTIGNTTINGYKGAYMPPVFELDDHWAPGNLIPDDTLINFSKINLDFNTDPDLFPFNN